MHFRSSLSAWYIPLTVESTRSMSTYYEGCWPTRAPEANLIPPAFTAVTKEDCDNYLDSRRLYETPYGAYFSPGLYCPSLWETVRMAARDTSSPLTSSGILTGYSHDDHLNCPDWIYDCEDSGSLMEHALQPRCYPRYLPFLLLSPPPL
jgi:hypothetical protein